MRVHEILPLYLSAASEIVDLSPDAADLQRHLRVPQSVRYRKCDLNNVDALSLGAETLSVCLLGPANPPTSDPAVLAPLLRRLQPGARAILLLGWPILELPYHRLLGPLVDGSCQVTEVVPVEPTRLVGARCALMVECVEKVAPLRSYLTDIPIRSNPDSRPEPDSVDELRTVLRVVNEFMLVDLVARPLRRRVIELEAATAEQAARLRLLERQLAVLEASTSLRIGRALVDGIRHPVRAFVTVPRDLALVWRLHRVKAMPTTAAHRENPSAAQPPLPPPRQPPAPDGSDPGLAIPPTG